MSIVSGTLGAVMGATAQNDASQRQKESAAANLAYQERIYNQQRSDFQPYQDAGVNGLGQMQNFDLMQGVGDPVNYDKEYTDKLGDYTQSAGYTAQNALGQKALQNQNNARGLNFGRSAANAGAELSQKLTATDFDKYKQDLGQRYTALQGEYAQRRDVNQGEYSRLLDQVKIGQGAASSAGQAGSQYGQQAGNAFNQVGAAALQAGQASAGMWSGLGGAAGNTAATGLKAYDTGSKAGWWGGNSGASGSQGTMVDSGASPWASSWETTGGMR